MMFSRLSSLEPGDARLHTNSDRTLLSLSKSTVITSPSRASFIETPVGIACLILTSKSPDKVALASCRTIIQSAIQSVVTESSRDTWDDDGCEVLYGRAGLLYGLLRLRKNELVSVGDLELVITSIMTRGRFERPFIETAYRTISNLRHLCGRAWKAIFRCCPRCR